MAVQPGVQQVTLSQEVESALHAYKRYAGVHDDISTIVDEAVREYLTNRGIQPPRGPLRITPWPHPSGDPTASIEHDRVLTEDEP